MMDSFGTEAHAGSAPWYGVAGSSASSRRARPRRTDWFYNRHVASSTAYTYNSLFPWSLWDMVSVVLPALLVLLIIVIPLGDEEEEGGWWLWPPSEDDYEGRLSRPTGGRGGQARGRTEAAEDAEALWRQRQRMATLPLLPETPYANVWAELSLPVLTRRPSSSRQPATERNTTTTTSNNTDNASGIHQDHNESSSNSSSSGSSRSNTPQQSSSANSGNSSPTVSHPKDYPHDDYDCYDMPLFSLSQQTVLVVNVPLSLLSTPSSSPSSSSMAMMGQESKTMDRSRTTGTTGSSSATTADDDRFFQWLSHLVQRHDGHVGGGGSRLLRILLVPTDEFSSNSRSCNASTSSSSSSSFSSGSSAVATNTSSQKSDMSSSNALHAYLTKYNLHEHALVLAPTSKCQMPVNYPGRSASRTTTTAGRNDDDESVVAEEEEEEEEEALPMLSSPHAMAAAAAEVHAARTRRWHPLYRRVSYLLQRQQHIHRQRVQAQQQREQQQEQQQQQPPPVHRLSGDYHAILVAPGGLVVGSFVRNSSSSSSSDTQARTSTTPAVPSHLTAQEQIQQAATEATLNALFNSLLGQDRNREGAASTTAVSTTRTGMKDTTAPGVAHYHYYAACPPSSQERGRKGKR